MFDRYFDFVMFETSPVQSESAWHNYDDCRVITSKACVLLLVSPAVMCHLTLTHAFAFVTCSSLAPSGPSPPPPPSSFLLSHTWICCPSSAGHKAQHYEALHSRTLSRKVWPHGLFWDLWAGSQWRVSLVFFFFKKNFIHFSCYLSEYSVNFSERFPVSSYIPAVVDHRGGMPCHGTFLLHQVSPCTSLHLELKDEEYLLSFYLSNRVKVWKENIFFSALCFTGHPEENHCHNCSWSRKWFWVEGGKGACHRWVIK